MSTRLRYPVAMSLLLLLACQEGSGDPACEAPLEVQVDIGTGVDVFMPLEDGDDLTLWAVREDWNRLAWVSARATGLVTEPTENLQVGIGLYQDDVLVGGTYVAGLAPTEGPGTSDYLGLRPRILTDDYWMFSGQRTLVEVTLQDGCERETVTEQDVWLWTPEDLCAARDLPVAQAEVVILAVGSEAVTLEVRLTELPPALYGEYSLRSVELEEDDLRVGGLEDEPRAPTWWTPEEVVFEALEVPLEAAAVSPSVVVDLRDACGRHIEAVAR